MQQYFYDLADFVQSRLQGDEMYTAWLSGEASDFVRFNHGKLRQAGRVNQNYLSLRLISGRKHCSVALSLSGSIDSDRAQLDQELDRLRDMLTQTANDPYLLLNSEPHSSERILPDKLPDTAEMVETVVDAAAGQDLVGFLASGPSYAGFANSYSQRNWHETASFNLDWSLYAAGDKAVKSAYAGTEWQADTFRDKLAAAAAQLELLRRPAKSIPPGEYRAYLAPAALEEIIDMLNWGGFSEKALRTKRSPLMKLADGQSQFSPAVGLVENIADGLAPGFQGDGFIKPGRTTLVDQGKLAGSLVSPRTAQEYGITTNGAGAGESSEALQMAGGELPSARVLSEIGTGLYIGNLWYCNFADRAAGRLTGMTRFATFWVENGELAAPLNVMRFDDTLYRMLGSQLNALTRERELIVETGTYGARQTASRLLPGAVLNAIRLVL
jgi:predicted Zn-dependent protease